MGEERKDEVEGHVFDAARDAAREAAQNEEPRDEAEVEGHMFDAARDAADATRAANDASRDAV